MPVKKNLQGVEQVRIITLADPITRCPAWRIMVQIKLKSKHIVVDDRGRIIMGEGRMAILATIEQAGSINQAAKIMKMSYKAMWSKIKSTEKHLGIKVVITDRKHGSRLSSEGKELLEKYRRLKRACREADDALFSDIFKE